MAEIENNMPGEPIPGANGGAEVQVVDKEAAAAAAAANQVVKGISPEELMGKGSTKFTDLDSRIPKPSLDTAPPGTNAAGIPTTTGQAEAGNGDATKTDEEKKAEDNSGNNEGDGGGDKPPEWPKWPENDKEWLTNPEYGRWLVDAVVWMRTKYSYEERYAFIDEETGRPYMERLYKALQKHVDAVCVDRHETDPWDPEKVYKEIDEEFKGRVDQPDAHKLGDKPPEDWAEKVAVSGKPEGEAEEPEEPGQSLDISGNKPETVDLSGLDSIDVLIKDYDDVDISPERFDEVKRQLGLYMQKAREKGMLKWADDTLNNTYQSIVGLPTEKAREEINEGMAKAGQDILDFFKRNRGDPEVMALKGIWKPYLDWSREILKAASQDQKHIEHREGELRLKTETEQNIEEETAENPHETYWEPSTWTGYYIIKARTPEQFRIAASTFLQMIRAGDIGKSPDDLYQHFENFKKQLGAEGRREITRQKGMKEVPEAERLTIKFMKEVRLELEAQAYVFGADYSNENYNPKSYNQFMMAMALHEGPERWTRLIRAGEGGVGAITQIFDKEDIMEIFMNPAGDRGELDTIAQHFVRDQIKQKTIERAIGIKLKDYDPEDTDPNSAIKLKNTKKARVARAKLAKANLERIGLHMSDEKFKELFEGYDDGSTHVLNYLRYGQGSAEALQQLPEGLRKGLSKLKELADQTKADLSEEQLQKLPKSLRDSIELGGVQVRLEAIRAKVRNRENKLKRGQTADRPAIIDLLTDEDKAIYEAAYEKAEANFDAAFQMQGATGEKVRRGKGFFYVSRNVHVQAFEEFERQERGKIKQRVQGYLDSGMVYELALQKVSEEKKGVIYKGIYEEDIDYTKLTLQEKRELFTTDSQWLGCMLSEMRGGKKLESFSKEEQDFYKGTNGGSTPLFTDEDRHNYVDNLPVHFAIDAVQCVENRTKILYSDESGIWDGNGFNKNGYVEITLANGKKVKFVTKAAYRTYMVGQVGQDAIREIKKKGFQAKFVLNKVKFNLDNPESENYGDVIGKDGDETETLSLKEAADSIYSRFTSHTYWFYQNENRHMILTPQVFAAAKRIRAGRSRPEDEDMLATQLLVLDPTLKRVRRFETDLVEREMTVMGAAVESSMQGHYRIVQNLFKEFLDPTGNRGRLKAGFNFEDWGGNLRFTMGIRELVATQPHRFARRFSAGLAFAPIDIDSMPAIWGQKGVMGAMNMFADRIKETSHQGVVSQFGITKFVDQMKYGVQLYEALVGRINPETGIEEEGLFKKPTNDSEKLQLLEEFYNLIIAGNMTKGRETKLLHGMLEAFGRLNKVIKLIGAHESLVRNSQGVLLLDDVDIFLPDGRYNPTIATDNNTGSGRHAEQVFFNSFMDWLLSEGPGGGMHYYGGEKWWYQLLSKPCTLDPTITRRQWIFNKIFS